MNQPDNEKQVEQVEQAPAEPLKVRTNLKAGQSPDPFTIPSDPSYSAVGVSGPSPIGMFDPIGFP